LNFYIIIIIKKFKNLENVFGALPQALEIIFGVQMKRSNEKIARRKISSQKAFFFLLVPLLLSNFFISSSF
jgi:hypothetical protein